MWDSSHRIHHRHYCMYCSEIVVCAFVDAYKMTSRRVQCHEDIKMATEYKHTKLRGAFRNCECVQDGSP